MRGINLQEARAASWAGWPQFAVGYDRQDTDKHALVARASCQVLLAHLEIAPVAAQSPECQSRIEFRFGTSTGSHNSHPLPYVNCLPLVIICGVAWRDSGGTNTPLRLYCPLWSGLELSIIGAVAVPTSPPQHLAEIVQNSPNTSKASRSREQSHTLYERIRRILELLSRTAPASPPEQQRPTASSEINRS
jgi:hypothetical protein